MGNELKIVEPETKELEAQGSSLLQRANALVVNDDESFRFAGDLILDSKKMQKAVDWLYEESIKAAHGLHKMLVAKSKTLSNPAIDAENIAKRKAGAYSMEQERKRQEDAARQRRAEEAKAEAERMAKAQEQMDKGDLKACEETLAAPLAPVFTKVQTPEAPKVAGISMRDKWFFEVTNVNEIPLEYMVPDLKAIQGIVNSLGAKTNIPGIRLWSEKVVAGRVFL